MTTYSDALRKMPLVGLGTWKLSGHQCVEVVKAALDIGYTHIDTAHVYDNHKDIGKGIRGYDRSSLFITSKLLIEDVDFSHTEKSVRKLCEKAIDEIGCGYLDLFLIHSPDHELAMHELIFAMEKLKGEKKILHIGVSNFTIHHMQDLLRKEAFFECNQVEFHPYLFQQELLEYCQRHRIRLVSYRPLGKGALLTDPIFLHFGKKYKKSPSQVILRWITQRNIPVIPKASSREHLRENLDIFDFSLSAEEVHAIDALEGGIRYCMPEFAEFSY